VAKLLCEEGNRLTRNVKEIRGEDNEAWPCEVCEWRKTWSDGNVTERHPTMVHIVILEQK
jgi:hypothetical protein